MKFAKKGEEKPVQHSLAEVVKNEVVVDVGLGKIRDITPTRVDNKIVSLKKMTYYDIPGWSLRHYQYNTGADIWMMVEKQQGCEMIRAEMRVTAKTPKEGRKGARIVAQMLFDMSEQIRLYEKEQENNG